MNQKLIYLKTVHNLCYTEHVLIIGDGMVWYGNNLFDITEIHNTLLETVLN